MQSDGEIMQFEPLGTHFMTIFDFSEVGASERLIRLGHAKLWRADEIGSSEAMEVLQGVGNATHDKIGPTQGLP